MYIDVNMCEKDYRDILTHLFPKRIRRERACFIFASSTRLDTALHFNLSEWYAVKPNEYKFQSLGYVELKDEMRPKIIKKAFDLNASIIEVHSHPYNTPAMFSCSDFKGFKEFVPHVWWRLKGKPYGALVFSFSDFDGLAWIDSPQHCEPITKLVVDENSLQANNLSLSGANE
ncbi:MAG: hypothetical protein ABSB71_12950 [Candidatus Bathyarchaeia archaeon]|jgi:hypothetical protein